MRIHASKWTSTQAVSVDKRISKYEAGRVVDGGEGDCKEF